MTVKKVGALYLLISKRNRIFTFEILASQIWGEEYIDIIPKTIHNLMSRVRHKLHVNLPGPEYAKSIRGVGYKSDVVK